MIVHVVVVIVPAFSIVTEAPVGGPPQITIITVVRVPSSTCLCIGIVPTAIPSPPINDRPGRGDAPLQLCRCFGQDNTYRIFCLNVCVNPVWPRLVILLGDWF